MRQGNKSAAKDADMSPFEAARKLLGNESERMSLGDRVECVFQDMDLVPLLVQVGMRVCAHVMCSREGMPVYYVYV